MSQVPLIALDDGACIPQLGFGVYKVPPNGQPRTPSGPRSRSATATSTRRRCTTTKRAWAEASAMRASTAATSSSPASSTTASTNPTMREGLSTPPSPRSGSDYVDLYLIHWPLPTRYGGDFVSTWRTLEEFAATAGPAASASRTSRSRIWSAWPPRRTPARGQPGRGAPLLHQCRRPGLLPRTRHRLRGLVAAGPRHRCSTTRWSNGSPRRSAGRPAQVVLRWHIQRGDIVFPKSVSPGRIAENFALFDFELGAADVEAIDGLDVARRPGSDRIPTPSTSSATADRARPRPPRMASQPSALTSDPASSTTTEGGNLVSNVPAIELNDGTRIPQLGFGVYPDRTRRDCRRGEDCTRHRLPTHRHRGDVPEREPASGKGVRDSGLDRARRVHHQQAQQRLPRTRRARRAFDETLSELGFDYVDLFLIHWPLPTLYGGDFVSTWKTLEEFKRDGRASSIGVSNFQVAHLERLAAETDTVPAVNQIEVHPYFVNEEVRALRRRARHRDRGVVAHRPGQGAR